MLAGRARHLPCLRAARRVALAAVAFALAACRSQPSPPAPTPLASAAPAEYVGSARCAACHAREHDAWRGSHHARAMLPAAPESVLGAFDGRVATHFGRSSRFFRRDSRFVVTTDGADGKRADFPVAFTFGVFPLQQYLVEAPGGRLQALPWAWDARPAGEGGQRFFHLYPGEILPPGDALHWTGREQTWNFMCAECHSTGVRKNYDAARDAYATAWSEVNVACEACHGPGSRHVAWSERREGGDRGLLVDLRDRRRATWVPDPGRPAGTRLVSAEGETRPATTPEPPAEIDACARCHARRSVIREPYVHGRPLLDNHRPALLDEGAYFADGQIDGETYEWGAFLQSRMQRAGVTCSDCHEPHGAALRAEGDALCTRCHAAERLATRAHHGHRRPVACVDCHMPERTYMRVDRRRDHSLRIPRPDLGAELGTPDACTACHRERSARWAASAYARLWGDPRGRGPHWGEALHAGRAGAADAEARLERLGLDVEAPGIARATALSLLAALPGPGTAGVLRRAARDPDALVRLGAAAGLAGLPPLERVATGLPLARDALLAVRLEAARVLAPARGALDANGRRDLDAALDEYRAAQQANAERPEARMNLGLLEAQLGDLGAAAAEYRHAARLDPAFTPAAVNLADVLRLAGRDAEGEQVLRAALARVPRDAALRHALGLRLVRAGRLAEALVELRAAARLAPGNERYSEVYRLARQAAASAP